LGAEGIGVMLRRSSATAVSRATPFEHITFGATPKPSIRLPHRMFMDLVAVLDVGIIVISAALAEALYIVLFLDIARDLQPILGAGLAGGLIFHYVARRRGLYQPAAILAWRDRRGDLMMSIGLSFLVPIAIAFLLKISAEYSRGWLLTWLFLTTLLLT